MEQLRMTRLRREEGFTLPEMLVAISIAMIVSLAAFALVETTMKKSADAAARVNATQRGRLAMDTITRQLRSQVCIATNVPAMYAATDSSASFYVDFTDQSNSDTPPELHRITYDPVAKTIVEYDTTGVSDHATPPRFTYDLAVPGRNKSKTLISNVQQYGNTPIFQYFGYDEETPPRPSVVLPAAAGMTATNLARVARIVVTFRSLPESRTSTLGSIVMQDEIYVRSADPNDPAPTPTCA
jgi:prepilin-type N-terminal cleavage/methylation domain-containing protein